MRKVFLIILVFFLALYFLAEYTLEDNTSPGVVKLRWSTDANPARKVQTELFSKMYPGVEIIVDPGSRQKVIVQCANGVGPDIIDMHQEGMIACYQAGILMDLTPYAEEMGFSAEHTYPSIREALLIGDKQYRYPCNVYANCVVYNKEIFDDHGVPYPKKDWTYEEFIETCKRIKNAPSKSGKKHLAVANWSPGWLVKDMMIGHGARYFSPDGLTSLFDSPQAIAAMQLYHDMIYVHGALSTPAEIASLTSQGGWGSFGLTWFSTGRAAMIFIGRWYIVQVPNYPKLKGKVGGVCLPRVQGLPSQGFCDTRAAGINANSPNKMEALKFLQFLASEEYGKLIVKDGDSLPPLPSLARNGQALVNDAVKDPEFHQAFVDATRNAKVMNMSFFVDPALVERWFAERVGQVENELVDPAAAMKSLAGEVNRKIRLNLEREPYLQKKYEEITGRPYEERWWEEYQRQPAE